MDIELARKLQKQLQILSKQSDLLSAQLETALKDDNAQVSDDKKIFDTIRSNFGNLDQIQVDSINAILNEFRQRNETDQRKISYTLATAWHETNLRPIEEIGKGAGHSYGAIDPRTGQAYYGRGLPQLTWYDNYKRMGEAIGIDLLNHPEKLLETAVSAKALVLGMLNGVFTGVSLSTYFNDHTNDPINARRIVNGTDRAELIASYYHRFLGAFS